MEWFGFWIALGFAFGCNEIACALRAWKEPWSDEPPAIENMRFTLVQFGIDHGLDCEAAVDAARLAESYIYDYEDLPIKAVDKQPKD